MRIYFFLFVAFVVGSSCVADASSDGIRSLSLFVEKLDSIRNKIDTLLTNTTTSSNHYDIAEETTTSNSTGGCFQTEKALRDAITKVNTNGPNYTIINLCAARLLMSGEIDPHGINVSYKWLDIRCSLKAKPCIINGQGRSGFFYGTAAHIKMDHIHFVKGYSEYGSMYFSNSNVQISHSYFQKNIGECSSIVLEGCDLLKLNDVTFIQNSAQLAHVFLADVTNLELNDVTFEQNYAKSDQFKASVYLFRVSESTISGTLFKRNGGIPLSFYEVVNSMITNSTFDGNYNVWNYSSAVLALNSKVTLMGVSFVNNILARDEGNTVGSAFSRVKLLGCTFTNNHGSDDSTNSSSIRVYDGDYGFMHGDLTNHTTLFCSDATKLCDGFPSNETIVDQYFKPFHSPTCTASLDC